MVATTGATIPSVTRRLSSAPGRRRSDVPGLRSTLLVPLVLLSFACGQATVTGQPTPANGTPSTSSSAEPGTSSAATQSSAEPTESAAPSSATPAGEAASGEPIGSDSAAACSGSDPNRDFYASMAAAVDWTVYCPVLPDGWFVDDGHYRLAGGGWMEISYDGPGDATIVLRQGAFCAEGDVCVPAGQEVGETPFGDRTGVLVAGDDGSWSVVAERGAARSWLLVMHGLDEAGARAIAAGLLVVSG